MFATAKGVRSFLTTSTGYKSPFFQQREKTREIHIRSMVTAYFDYQDVDDPLEDGGSWSESEVWDEHYPNDGMGACMAGIITWAILYRDTSLSLNTINNNYCKYIYVELKKRFPIWSSPYYDSLAKLQRRSPIYSKAIKSISRIVIGESHDIKRSTPMFLPDVRRLCKVVQPTSKGYRCAALVYCMAETAARGIAFVEQPFTDFDFVGPNNDICRLTYPAMKVKGVDMAPRILIMSKEGSKWMKLYIETRENSVWKNPNTLFGLKDTSEIANFMGDLCKYAGYPVGFFTSHSGRSGKINTVVANSVLKGESISAAIDDARVIGDFIFGSSAMRRYVRDTADRANQFKDSRDDVSEMLVQELHHSLEGDKLCAQYQFTRFAPNDGMPPALVKKVTDLVTTLKGLYFGALQGVDGSEKTFSNTCEKIAETLYENNLLHDKVLELGSNMTGVRNPALSIAMNCMGRIVNCLLRNNLMDSSNFDHVDVPEHIEQYFSLPYLPTGFKQQPRVYPEKELSRTTDVAHLMDHLEKRLRICSKYFILIGTKKAFLEDMNHAQRLLVIKARENNVDVKPAAYNKAGDKYDCEDEREDNTPLQPLILEEDDLEEPSDDDEDVQKELSDDEDDLEQPSGDEDDVSLDDSKCFADNYGDSEESEESSVRLVRSPVARMRPKLLHFESDSSSDNDQPVLSPSKTKKVDLFASDSDMSVEKKPAEMEITVESLLFDQAEDEEYEYSEDEVVEVPPPMDTLVPEDSVVFDVCLPHEQDPMSHYPEPLVRRAARPNPQSLPGRHSLVEDVEDLADDIWSKLGPDEI